MYLPNIEYFRIHWILDAVTLNFCVVYCYIGSSSTCDNNNNNNSKEADNQARAVIEGSSISTDNPSHHMLYLRCVNVDKKKVSRVIYYIFNTYRL